MTVSFNAARGPLKAGACKAVSDLHSAVIGSGDYEQDLISPTRPFRKDPDVQDKRGADAVEVPRVLIVEDERRLASVLWQHLTDLKLAVHVEHDGNSGLEAAASSQFDLIILDVVLPGMDGFGVCRELRRRGVTTPIMMLSARGVIEDRVRGLDSGADDYLTKPFEFEELSARIRALLRRQRPAAALTVVVGDITLDPVARTVQRGDRRVELTQKEFALLEYMMRNADQVLTRAMIGEQVWDFTWDRMTNVIDVYVNHLRRKLEDGGEPRMIHAVRGVGYVLRSTGGVDDQDA